MHTRRVRRSVRDGIKIVTVKVYKTSRVFYTRSPNAKRTSEERGATKRLNVPLKLMEWRDKVKKKELDQDRKKEK